MNDQIEEMQELGISTVVLSMDSELLKFILQNRRISVADVKRDSL